MFRLRHRPELAGFKCSRLAVRIQNVMGITTNVKTSRQKVPWLFLSTIPKTPVVTLDLVSLS